ncbi:MAG: 4-hydroxythreonine-4-phosphate dehydrogenase PdxA [Hyphomicrobium sp.]|nr:MAG: 4-hydroxythreonine-4-phosphate dehydrogenase PdxA [Hyphomicrobium sp.]PPC99663.1 MAG: 4-hydroxythreonine-4-phosphate dehydrogenase PdxA [Hyphomicrobium sp.]
MLTRPTLGVTMGDPAGIGPDITLHSWLQRTTHKLPPFIVYADPDVLAQRARDLGINVPIEMRSTASQAAALSEHALRVVSIPLSRACTPGQPNSAHASAIVGAIDRAVADSFAGNIAAMVTNPIAKSVLYEAGFAHPGHTEYLGTRARIHWPTADINPIMMLACDDLRVVPLTIHIPLSDVPKHITTALIEATARTLAKSLKKNFGISQPRIAVCGLNPHAGEAGTIGLEDRDIIAPAIASLVQSGLHITGPHSADTLFHAAARRNYDAVLAMYHDQALIPIKTLAFDEGVNVTLGLPFIRTSPDHGTAFDIAGKGLASPNSFIAALKLAERMVTRHREYTP